MIGPMAPESAKIAPKAMGMMRPITAQPATALSLNLRHGDRHIAPPAGVATLASTAGMAKRAIRAKSYSKMRHSGLASSPCTWTTPHQAHRQHGQMRDEGGDGGPVDAEPEPIDQDRVEDCSNDRPGQRDVHGTARIACRAQDRGGAHADRQRRQ